MGESQIGRTYGILLSTKIIAAAVGFITTIYFARILGAETLGYYYLIVAVVAWLKLAGIGGIETATIKRISEAGERGYAFTSAVLLFLFLSIISVVIFILEDNINAYVGITAHHYILLLLLIGILTKYTHALLKGSHLVDISGILYTCEQIVNNIITVVFIIAGLGLGGLIFGPVIGGLVISSLGLSIAPVKYSIPTVDKAKRIISFAKYSWIGSIQARSFNDLDVIILGFFSSASLVGIYSIAWGISKFLIIFGASVSTTFFPEISQISSKGDKEDDVSALINKSFVYTGIFLFPGVIGGIILSEKLLSLYGPQFVEGVPVLRILLIGVLVYGFQDQCVNALNGVDQPRFAFYSNITFIGSNAILNVLLIYTFGWLGAAIATTVSALIGLVLSYYLINRLVDIKFPTLEIGYQIIASLIMGIVVYVSSEYIISDVEILSPGAEIIFLVILGAGLYASMILVFSAQMRDLFGEEILSRIDFPSR